MSLNWIELLEWAIGETETDIIIEQTVNSIIFWLNIFDEILDKIHRFSNMTWLDYKDAMKRLSLISSYQRSRIALTLTLNPLETQCFISDFFTQYLKEQLKNLEN